MLTKLAEVAKVPGGNISAITYILALTVMCFMSKVVEFIEATEILNSPTENSVTEVFRAIVKFIVPS